MGISNRIKSPTCLDVFPGTVNFTTILPNSCNCILLCNNQFSTLFCFDSGSLNVLSLTPIDEPLQMVKRIHHDFFVVVASFIVVSFEPRNSESELTNLFGFLSIGFMSVAMKSPNTLFESSVKFSGFVLISSTPVLSSL